MWGDGKQTRSFTYIDDCVEGILRLTKSDFAEPVNLGSDEMVSMNEMQALALGEETRGDETAAAATLFHPSALKASIPPSSPALNNNNNGAITTAPFSLFSFFNLLSCDLLCRRRLTLRLGFANKPDMPIKHIPGPEGVRGRNSNNELIKEKLGYAPSVKLADGLKVTFEWISGQIAKEVAGGANAEEAFSKSTICGTMAPTELGALRAKDGEENYTK